MRSPKVSAIDVYVRTEAIGRDLEHRLAPPGAVLQMTNA
jgi:hypothetical protein